LKGPSSNDRKAFYSTVHAVNLVRIDPVDLKILQFASGTSIPEGMRKTQFNKARFLGPIEMKGYMVKRNPLQVCRGFSPGMLNLHQTSILNPPFFKSATASL